VSRDNVLHKIRTALGRGAGQAAPDPPAARIRIPLVSMDARVASMLERVRALAGEAVATDDARAFVAEAIAGKTALASNAPLLAECGITSLPGVRSGITDREELRELCAAVDVGITSADYALADTGTLVMLASPQEARMISLLPPAHIAVVPRERILTGLDELFSLLPNPAERRARWC
jgi:L-lactate dehydrogenase complex protein LldG